MKQLKKSVRSREKCLIIDFQSDPLYINYVRETRIQDCDLLSICWEGFFQVKMIFKKSLSQTSFKCGTFTTVGSQLASYTKTSSKSWDQNL